jgi:hypothetical protein
LSVLEAFLASFIIFKLSKKKWLKLKTKISIGVFGGFWLFKYGTKT